MNIFSLSGLFVSASTCLLSIFILTKGRKKIHYIWALFCLAVSLWGFGVFKIGREVDEILAIIWWQIAYVGVIFIPVLYLHFICEFLNKRKNIFIFVVYLFTFIFLFLNIATNLFIGQLKFLFDSFYYLSEPSLAFNLFVIFFFSLVIYSIVILGQAHKISQGHFKNQIKYFLLASYIGYSGGLFAFLPVYGIYLYPTLNILIAVFPFIIVYAIFRHQLMDVRAVMQLSLVYSSSLAFIVGIYIVILFFLDLLFHNVNELIAPLAAGFTTVFGIYTVPLIEKYFRKKTDKIFFKDKYDYSQAIYDLSKILNKNINIEVLLRETSEELMSVLKVKRLRFILLNDNLTFDEERGLRKSMTKIPKYMVTELEKEMAGILSKQDIPNLLLEAQKNNNKEKVKALIFAQKNSQEYKIDLFVPIFLEKKLVAMLLLGKKLSGDLFAQEDYSLLKTFSYQAGVALEKARLFEEVKNYSTELEKKVEQRTAKIKGLQEEQGQMMHEMAHGLQTPLTILKSELSQASNEIADNTKFKLIERSIDRISKMIYDMLRLARLESGKQANVFSEFDLSELLEELVESFEIIASSRDIKLEYNIQSGVTLYGSRVEVEELVNNLVSNSMKYTKDKGIKNILIELKTKNKKINLNISDTGIGMSKDTLKHLFKRFYRAKNEPGYEKKGTGLGLVIAKKIIEKHKGVLKVQSKLKQGSKFSIVFNK